MIRFIMISYCLTAPTVYGQMLNDSASVTLVKKCVDDIYNFQFDSARDISQKINHFFPQHPVVYLLNGMIMYWENYPLIPSSPARKAYEYTLQNCIRLCESKHTPEDSAEYLLANLGARGMLLLFYFDNNLTKEVFPLVISTYRYIRQSFEYTSHYFDFFYFTGLYNYSREAFPEVYPVYKMVAFLFPKGNKEKGLREIQTAAENSIMLKAESLNVLSEIYLSFENNYQQACIYSKSLHEMYPANSQYLADYIKNLLLVKKYDEAEGLVRSYEGKMGNPYFRAQLAIFKGILYEKKYHSYTEAQDYYNKGVSDISVFGNYGNEFAAYAYFGLSRIDDDKHSKETFRKKAMEIADYKNVNFDE
jgi:hypothetical protein